MRISKRFGFFLFTFLLNSSIFGQIKEKVEVIPKIFPISVKICKEPRLGTIVFFLQPDYPPEAIAARVGGSVRVNVKLNEKGSVAQIEKAVGHKLLQGASLDAARKVKFTPTFCGTSAIGVQALLIYNFIPYNESEIYFKAAKIEDFPDVKPDLQFYEAIVDLTENYKIAFGYENKNFYADAPLTRGDFAHFLRLTLDLLSERARISGKLPRAINLFFSLNPQNLKTIDKIKGLGRKEPAAESVKVVLLKYDVALVEVKKEFQGRLPITQSEVVDLWTKIFGADAVPVNFDNTKADGALMTRGEFALFLQESLGVLTYKVLP